MRTNLMVGGGGGGFVSFGDITGAPTDNAALVAYVESVAGGSLLTPVILGAGPTAITHADHSNRDVSSAQTASASVVFAVTATSGAVNGDLVTIRNIGPGTLVASGAILAKPGFKLTAVAGEDIIAEYDGATDSYYSKTIYNPVNRFSSGEPNTYTLPLAGFATVATVGGALAQLDTSALAVENLSTSTAFGQLSKIRCNGAAAAVSRMAGIRIATPSTASPYIIPSASFRGGFRWHCVGAVGDAIAAGQFGMGLYKNNNVNPQWTDPAGTNVQPSALTDCIMMAADSTDTNMQIMYNDASGTCTKIDLGSGYPANSNAADMYSLYVEVLSNGTAITYYYVATNISTREAKNGFLTTNVPAAGVQMGWLLARGSAGSATTPSMLFMGQASGGFLR